MENSRLSEIVRVEDVLKVSVDALAQLALRQQAQLQQLTAPRPPLKETIAALAQQLPFVLPLIEALRRIPFRVSPMPSDEGRRSGNAPGSVDEERADDARGVGDAEVVDDRLRQEV